MPQKLASSDSRFYIVALFIALTLAFQAYVFVQSRADIDALRGEVSDFDQAALDLLGAIGYSGLIHHFKNCVIRAAEPDYCDKAAKAAEEARKLVDRLTTAAATLGSPGELPSVRKMIDAYGERAEHVRALHLQGRRISNIDAEVRFDDLPATREILTLRAAAGNAFAERLSALQTRLQGLVFAGWLGLLAILAGLWALRRDQITRREREREVQEERLATVLDTVANGVVGLSRENEIVIVNSAGRHMLGGVVQETPFAWPGAIKFLDRADLHPLEASADPIARALAGQDLLGEILGMTRMGGAHGHRYVRLSSRRVHDEIGDLHAVVVLDDVSEAEQRRQQIERSSRLDALGQLTGGIAHDFNNILATIRFSLDLALLDPSPEQTRRVCENALGAVRRGADLTGRLLAFAKGQPGRASSRPVGEVIADVLALMKPTIQESIAISTRIDDPELVVFCDQRQLENALVNLILNSRDAIVGADKGDRIIVEARGVSDIGVDRGKPDSYVSASFDEESRADRERGDGSAFRYVEIAVTDNGPGMSEEVKRRAIDPFFTTKSAGSGTGLGLSTVYGFVQQAGGELRLYSDLGHGASVRMLLPRGVAGDRREAPVERAAMPAGSGETVLIVEDEDVLLSTISELAKALGYRVLTARNGAEALKIFEQGVGVDVLLTDVVMPGVGGFELAQRVRRRLPTLPIIYMSGYTGFSDKEMGEVVAPLLGKPCSPADLAKVLRAALASRTPA